MRETGKEERGRGWGRGESEGEGVKGEGEESDGGMRNGREGAGEIGWEGRERTRKGKGKKNEFMRL